MAHPQYCSILKPKTVLLLHFWPKFPTSVEKNVDIIYIWVSTVLLPFSLSLPACHTRTHAAIQWSWPDCVSRHLLEVLNPFNREAHSWEGNDPSLLTSCLCFSGYVWLARQHCDQTLHHAPSGHWPQHCQRSVKWNEGLYVGMALKRELLLFSIENLAYC